ncbi:hypothetical protein LXL04_000923 [Taraxacum kok-saghyz]
MALVKEGGSMSYQVPVLTPTNNPVWAIKVKLIMDAHGIWETVETRALGIEADSKKKKQALAFLCQAIPKDTVLQMASYTDSKQVWNDLKTRELEGLRMNDGETVDKFMTKLTGLASKAISLGYELKEVDLVKRLLDSMPKFFLQIVASIEQCFDLDSLLFDEAIGRLKAYEERLKGTRKPEDTQGGLLLASHEKAHGCKRCGCGGSNQYDFGHGRRRGQGSGKSRDGNERVRDKSHVKCYKCGDYGRGSGKSRDGNERVRDTSHVKCYKCGDYGHYSNECPKWESQEANLIEEELALL